MNCRRVRELLPLYADGELEGPALAPVTAHLAGCEACCRRLAADRELAARLAALPAAEDADRVAAHVRERVMDEVEKKRRWQPFRRLAERAGNVTVWVGMSALVLLLVVGLAITWRPLVERRRQGASTSMATATPAGAGWEVVNEQVIASPYYWVIDGERVDRTPQLSPDGTKVAYLPTVDSEATRLTRLVVRDLNTGQDLDLTPEEGYSYTSVRWSPDGRSLAFVKHRDQEGEASLTEVWRIDAGGGNLKLLYRPLPVPEGAMGGPALQIARWSGDGQHLYLDPTIWGGGGIARRVRADGGGEEAQVAPLGGWFGVSDDALVGDVIYAPTDDYALHFVMTSGLPSSPKDAPADGQSLVLYDMASKESRVLASFAGTAYIPHSGISPDGEWICFSNRNPQSEEPTLWVVRRDGTGLRQVMLNGKPAPAMPGPYWAGGGRAYFNQPLTVSSIWICALDAPNGQVRPIAHRYPATDIVSVSRDGRRVLFIRGGWEGAELVLLELGPRPEAEAAPARMALYHQGQADELTADLSVYEPVAQLAGQVLAGVEGDIQAALLNPWEEAERVKREGVALEAIYAEPGVQVGAFTSVTAVLIPLDGDADIFLGRERYEHRVPAQAEVALATLRQVFGVGPRPTDEPPPPPTVAPEAPAFGEAQDLFTPPPSAASYHISPDGRWVACPLRPEPATGAAPRHRLVAHNVETGAEITLFESPHDITHVAWFPDSERMVAVVGGPSGAIIVCTLGDNAVLHITAPDGSQDYGEAVVSHDGRRIAFTVYHDAGPAPVPTVSVNVIDADGANRHQLVMPDHFIRHLAWTPDGTELVYFQGKGGTPPEDGDAYVVDAKGETAPRHLASGFRPAAWSPSGGQLLWLSEPADDRGRADLALSPWPAAGEPQLLARAVGMAGAAWAGSDGWVVFSQDGALYLGLAGDSGVLQRLTPEGEVADAPVWLPGRGLAYRVARDGHAALRLLPAGSAAPSVTPEAVPVAGAPLVSLSMINENAGWGLGDSAVLRTTDGGAVWSDVTPHDGSVRPRFPLAGAHFFDVSHAWVASTDDAPGEMILWRTADGGLTWQRGTLPVEGMGVDLSFIDERRGWALVHQGAAAGSEAVTVLGTGDGGDTWRVLAATDPQNPAQGSLPFGGSKSGITRLDEEIGWIAGFAPVDGRVYLYVTHDGGCTWQEQALALPEGYEQAQASTQPPAFFSATDGVLVANLWHKSRELIFFVTRDGGATWSAGTPVSAPDDGRMLYDFASADHGWVVVPDDRGATALLRTQDGGRTWESLTPNLSLAGASAIEFADERTGWALCFGEQGPYQLRTRNAGEYWAPLEARMATVPPVP